METFSTAPKGPSVVWPRQQTGRTWVPSRHSFTALGSRRIARGKHQICGLRRSARQQEAGSPVLPHTGAWRTSAAPQTSSCSAQTRTVGGLHVTSSLCCYTVFFFQVINKNDYICKKKRKKKLFFFTLGWKLVVLVTSRGGQRFSASEASLKVLLRPRELVTNGDVTRTRMAQLAGVCVEVGGHFLTIRPPLPPEPRLGPRAAAHLEQVKVTATSAAFPRSWEEDSGGGRR